MSALQLCRSFVAMAGISFNGAAPVFDQIQLDSILDNWRRKHTHHGTDQVYKADFTNSHSNEGIEIVESRDRL
jgi:hypothetical protein